MTTVRPTARPLEQLALVDVTDPARGVERPVGTEGARDTVFRTGDRHAVPEVAGTSFEEASRLLADAGLGAASDGPELPPDDARVLGSDPVAGTRLAFGEYVTLRVAEDSGGSTDGGGAPSGSGDGEGSDVPSSSFSSFVSPSSVPPDTSSEPATPSGAAAAPSSSPAVPAEPPPVTRTAGSGPTSEVPVPDDGDGTGTA
ncbi:PASTA domain-containing protein [Streptomyces hyaluromycini]|uniref:PASTA domain-containing protein n=1 Tax=Streptomyces hyaluromycini TaxID=1377993 RepID=UPI001FEAF4B2|nr:PASTA domain-containing protein [Streptomyces hyaluromycini]